MPLEQGQQTPRGELLVGVDVGGTFTDLVAFDTASGELKVVKVPSTPPDFERAVLDAVGRVLGGECPTFDVQRPTSNEEEAASPGVECWALDVGRWTFAQIVHGSTVATNALLQRAGEPVAFVTTEGFRDLLLIGRQDRPKLYALHVRRPPPITPEANWFTVRERIGAAGEVVVPLEDGEIDRLVRDVQRRGLRHAAVCLLFSFVNPDHERRVGRALEAAGVTVSLSCDVLPEFREYERASTTAINASLRPVVAAYLAKLSGEWGVGSGEAGAQGESRPGPNSPLPTLHSPLLIMHSGGGTLSVADAAKQAAKLVLSGPAGA